MLTLVGTRPGRVKLSLWIFLGFHVPQPHPLETVFVTVNAGRMTIPSLLLANSLPISFPKGFLFNNFVLTEAEIPQLVQSLCD